MFGNLFLRPFRSLCGMSRWDRRAVGGFSEELPAMLVILIALSIFIAGAAHAFSSWGERKDAVRDRERVATFAGQICAEQNLTWHGRLAMFDMASLSGANTTA